VFHAARGSPGRSRSQADAKQRGGPLSPAVSQSRAGCRTTRHPACRSLRGEAAEPIVDALRWSPQTGQRNLLGSRLGSAKARRSWRQFRWGNPSGSWQSWADRVDDREGCAVEFSSQHTEVCQQQLWINPRRRKSHLPHRFTSPSPGRENCWHNHGLQSQRGLSGTLRCEGSGWLGRGARRSESQPPSQIHRQEVGFEEQDCRGRAYACPGPVASVDDKVDPAPEPRWYRSSIAELMAAYSPPRPRPVMNRKMAKLAFGGLARRSPAYG